MPLTLYYHPLASFCHKVLVALYENGIEFEKRLINLADGVDRAELQAIWPLCKFPVIRDQARARELPETTIIIEYLDRFFPGEHPLIPADWEDALEVRLWDRIFDNYVQLPMQGIVSDRMRGAKGDLSNERATLETTYAMTSVWRPGSGPPDGVSAWRTAPPPRRYFSPARFSLFPPSSAT
jgi:glutathione S-transferase